MKLPVFRDIVRMCEREEIFLAKLVSVVAKDVAVGRIYIQKPASRTGKYQPNGSMRKSTPKTAFALLKRLFSLFALAYIEDELYAFAVVQHLGGKQTPPPRSVLSDVLLLVRCCSAGRRELILPIDGDRHPFR